ncbi:fatty acyl-CoA reductase wat-like [Photinus pyralis]|nr:fatty acyl-CoA reductase wat-like [Photinus pyralis]
MSQVEKQRSTIEQFFSGGRVFLTGATGFMGKLTLEKLLRSCEGLEKIYVLVRVKKQKDVEDRLEELFQSVVFDRLKMEQPDFKEKVVLIPGDCVQPDLGLNLEDKAMLMEKVNCIFHFAATVRFDQKIRTAAYINVRATRDLLRMANRMFNLKSFVYMSTAYSYCVQRDIGEEFYKPPITGENLLKLVDSCSDDFLDKITPTLLGDWPNTYAFSKAIAEDVVLNESGGLPLAIVRPSIVIPTAKEPIEGFIDNYYGLTGVLLASAVGLIHVLYAKSDALSDIVPADYAINNAIAAAWSVGVEEPENNVAMGDCRKPPIFNYVSTRENPLTMREIMRYGETHFAKYPMKNMLCFYFLTLTSNYYLYITLKLLFHYIPAYIVDFVARLIGKKPFLVDGYSKIGKFMSATEYFSINQWKFSNDNTQALYRSMSESDKKKFCFDMGTIDWNAFFDIYARGVRVYLAKDPMETLPEAKRWLRKLQVMYHIVICTFWIGLLWTGYSLVKFVF